MPIIIMLPVFLHLFGRETMPAESTWIAAPDIAEIECHVCGDAFVRVRFALSSFPEVVGSEARDEGLRRLRRETPRICVAESRMVY